MKILHVVPSVASGGAERVLAELVRNTRSTHDHHVVSMTPGTPFFDLSGAHFESLSLARGYFSASALFRFRALAKRVGPDIVHGWLYHGNALASFVRDRGKPIVWSIHNTDLPPERTKRLTRNVNRAAAACSGFIPSRIVYAGARARRVHEHIGYDPTRGVTIANGIDLHAFSADAELRKSARAAFGVNPWDVVIGSIGRFDPQKDHATLIRAFARVRAQVGSVLVIAGAGCDVSNETLMQWIRTEGVEDAVRLLGPRSDVPAVMNGLDVLAISSSYGEAMPVVALEAAATGLPIAATDIGDVADFLLDDSHTAAPGDPAALASALMRAAKDGAHSNAEAERRRHQRLTEKYSIETMVGSYVALYQSLVENNR